MKNRVILVLTIGFLSSCSTPSSLTPEMQAELKEEPVVCRSVSECKTMWKRAFEFVRANAGYEIKTANDAVIATGVARRDTQSRKLSIKVTKSPIGGDRYDFKMWVWCARGISIYRDCEMNPLETIWRAKQYITSN